MATPTVTITVGGVPVSAMTAATTDVTELVKGLHMMYVQATQGDVRYQWVIFPPAVSSLDLPAGVTPSGKILMLKRKQDFAGNRSKWFHYHVSTPAEVVLQLESVANADFTVTEPVVVPLEHDDYRSAWSGDTPHKALRAVDRALKPLQLSVK